ncbi:hypothetical protein [Flagellimonas pelagia]|uniref:Collagen-like protein n=1 Tax=Flagellimonas pelagia TaxID=2306998 RepID=A0A3A1NE46_9FLAO|nr:hypothetical protein [Allomuricauda maritima]RIV42957.1 hypothetical protein D2V05_15210 [Allomuricauda maritima]TXJ92155.1 hypothetical protein FQ017_15075 [Allomuricauda maritima]
MRLSKIIGSTMLFMSLVMVSCSDGTDGMDGTNGLNGINGTDGKNGVDGTNGEDGQNGSNGVGYDELAKYGQITVDMEGVRPDGEAYQDSAIYRYTAVEASTIPKFNSVSVSDNITSFKIRRFLSTPDEPLQTSFFQLDMEIQDLGGASQQFGFLHLYTLGYTVIGQDHKFFYLDGEDFVLIDDSIIQDFDFDDTSNHLTYNFSVTLPAGQNSSGNEVTFSGTVDVTVLEEVEVP